MVEAFGVAALVAFEIGDVAAFVRVGLVSHTRTHGQVIAERPHRPVVFDPLAAFFTGPVVLFEFFPLAVEVPAQRHRPTPQDPAQVRDF